SVNNVWNLIIFFIVLHFIVSNTSQINFIHFKVIEDHYRAHLALRFTLINVVYVTAAVSIAREKLNLYPSGSCRFEIFETQAEGAAEMKENYISRKLIRQRQNVKDLPLGSCAVAQ
ncbi:hypothetical protein E2986_12976, partial [Frieseomelitta varia]